MSLRELLIQKGKTFTLPVRWETEPIVRKPITGISFASGAPRLTVASHGIPDGWRVLVTRVKGPTQINAQSCPPRASDYVIATVVDSNTVELNSVTPVDCQGREWPAYVSGGFVEFYTPVDLTGYTARMSIKDKIGGTLLASSLPADAPLDVLLLTVLPAENKVLLEIDADDTATIGWKKGVAELEMISPQGVVTKPKLCSGKDEDPDPVRVAGEVAV